MNQIDGHNIKAKQLSPLPIGSGRTSSAKRQMNNTNIQLGMLNAQATTDTKYDPPVPEHITKPVIKESFMTSDVSISQFIGVLGALLIVYGIIAK
jgi:hypothetical protein